MPARPKRPRDPNQLGKLIADLATGAAQEKNPASGKNEAAAALGRLGGLKGGKARASRLSPEERSRIAKKGGLASAAKRTVTGQLEGASGGHDQPILRKKKRRAVIQAPED